MIRPLTLCIHEVNAPPTHQTLGLWRTDQLFSMLDELCTATLERVTSENDAQFIVELVPTTDPEIVSLLLRESIVVMASQQIATTAGLDQWERVAKYFASMIDTAAECYASPLATV